MAGLEWHGDAVLRLIAAAGAKGLSDGIDLIGETSQERVLVQTTELKRSWTTHKDTDHAVGGYTDSKAVGAHENLAVQPRTRRQPLARAKFLESAAADRADDVRDAVADQIRKVL